MIMTVTGPVDALPPGAILPHEHVMSVFGHNRQDWVAYNEERLFAATIPYLRHLRSIGLGAIADCTASGIGRRPDLLRVISQESGVAILTNTGYYGAAGGRYLPADLASLTAREISERWIREYEEGINGSGIRPGFIKTGIDNDRLSAIDRTLITAAALAHRRTGLLVQTHTGDHPGAAGEILGTLRSGGVHPSAWVWVHAHLVQDITHLIGCARAGCWISLDGLHASRDASILATLLALKAEGLLDRVLLSHDGNTYTAEGSCRPYDHLLTEFQGRLIGAGFTDSESSLLTRENPARAFDIRPRLTT